MARRDVRVQELALRIGLELYEYMLERGVARDRLEPLAQSIARCKAWLWFKTRERTPLYGAR